MSKQYKIKINGGPDNKQVIDLEQGAGDRGQPIKIKAISGVRYQLEDSATGFAPENIRAKRVGKDLRLSLEGSLESDVVIEDYYEVMPAGYNGVIGQAESGRFYEYIPESASGASSVQALNMNSVPVGMALGGSEVQASGAAVGVLLAAGVNPLLFAPLALLGLAGGGGGGGGSGSTATKPVVTAHLTSDSLNDTGSKSDDGITSNNHPEISGTATANSVVSVTVNNKTYSTTAGADGSYKIQIPATDTLLDGVYPIKMQSTLNGQTSGLLDGTPLVIDTSSGNNYPPNGNPSVLPDPNAKATVSITSIVDAATNSMDSGASATDFITNDNTVTYKGLVSGFVSNGDVVLLKLTDSNNALVSSTYVTPDSTGAWSWNRTGVTQADGTYALTATIVDAAGNMVNTDTGANGNQKVVIDTSSGNNYSPNATPDANIKATIDILSITTDTGISNSDFVTNNNALLYKGKVTGFTNNGDVVLLEFKDNANAVVASATVSPDSAGNWVWDNTGVNRLDGAYTLKASIIDLAGNAVNPVVPTGANLTGGGYDTQSVVIDTSTSQNYKPGATPDANATALVKITTIVDAASNSNDTGTFNNDFVTNDQTLSYKGTVTDAAGKSLSSVWVQVELKDVNGVVKATDYKQTDAQGNWLWNNTAATTPEGTYNVYATVIDDAGNKVSAPASHSLVIDTTPPVSAPTNIAMSDSGSVANGTLLDANYGHDSITNSPNFSYKPSETGQGVVTQFSLDSGKSWVTASTYPIDLSKDGVADGNYAQLLIKNIDAAGNSGPAAIYAVPFTIDTTAPTISQFALDSAKKSVGFSVNESGWYNYTVLDATNHATSSSWTYVPVAPSMTSSLFIPLPTGTYAASHFQLNFQDIAGNTSHVSNTVDWTLSVVAPSITTLQLSPETSLDLSGLSLANPTAISTMDVAHTSSLDTLTLKMSDLLSQSLSTSIANMPVVNTSGVADSLLTLHDLMSATGGVTHLQVDLPNLMGTMGGVDPMADLLAYQSTVMTH